MIATAPTFEISEAPPAPNTDHSIPVTLVMVEDESTYHFRRFHMKGLMLENPYPAQVIEEREILLDKALMAQVRPAMIAHESGQLLSKSIPWQRTTRKKR